MKEVISVYQQGIIGIIEQFTYAVEELRQYVVYTYYDKDWNLLYIGRSKNYYHARVDLSRGYFAFQYGFEKAEGCQPLLAAK